LTEAERFDDEVPHQRRIPRSFSIASRPVTVAECQQFLKDRPDVFRPITKDYSPDPEGPIVTLSWYNAAQYCNWLSEKEGLPETEWCYPPHSAIKEGMKPFPDHLTRHGYRLPTEAEWEYAARAGATTSRYYGSPIELLPRYAWYAHNAQDRAWPVGQKRPNDLGLFDTLGNVWNWVQDPYSPYPRNQGAIAIADGADLSEIQDRTSRVLRGGSFVVGQRIVRLAYRNEGGRPSIHDVAVGLRLARTLP